MTGEENNFLADQNIYPCHFFNQLKTLNYSGSIRPNARPNTLKYGPGGLFKAENIHESIPRSLAEVLTTTGNFSLSASTWSTYSTALTQLQACSSDLNITLALPISENETLTFVAWLVKKNLQASTIESYLSGLRLAQISLGLGNQQIRTPLVNQIISGRKNQTDSTQNSNHNLERLPVTPKMLLLIKKDLKTANMPKQEKLAIWATCTLLFYGAFRGGEILSKHEHTFDPLVTLTGEDVELQSILVKGVRSQILQVRLKTEKKANRSSVIDIFPNNNDSCPVAAWKKWASQALLQQDLPAFRKADGSNLTCKNMNAYLKAFNRKYINIPGKSISVHSFRAGLPTMLGKMGYSDSDIQATGRWSSRAFEIYCKLPRSKRLEMAKKISSIEFD